MSAVELPFPEPLPEAEGWNPYFVAYAAFHGRTPAEQDTAGAGWRFINWIHGEWRVWRAETETAEGQAAKHAAVFEAWLFERNNVPTFAEGEPCQT